MELFVKIALGVDLPTRDELAKILDEMSISRDAKSLDRSIYCKIILNEIIQALHRDFLQDMFQIVCLGKINTSDYREDNYYHGQLRLAIR